MALRELLLALGFAVFAASCPAQDVTQRSDFRYDRQLALDLGGAYAHSLARAMEHKSPLVLDFKNPQVVARIFKGDRHLIQVSYGSDRPDAGAEIVLEQCKESGLMTVVDSDYFEDARVSPAEIFAAAKPDTYYAGPTVCRTSRDAP